MRRPPATSSSVTAIFARSAWRSERGRDDQGAQLDQRGARRQRGKQRPGLVIPDLRSVDRSVQEVVADPEAVGAAGFCLSPEGQDLRPVATSVLGRLRETQPDPHRHDLPDRGNRAEPAHTGLKASNGWRQSRQ